MKLKYQIYMKCSRDKWRSSESITLLESLRNSALYREDQNSYILYPERVLPQFIQKNNISDDDFNSSDFLQELVEMGNRDIVIRDVNGEVHFNGEIRNAAILKSRLKEMGLDGVSELIAKEEDQILNIYESVFNHKEFTGRSGTFYKYEGLG